MRSKPNSRTRRANRLQQCHTRVDDMIQHLELRMNELQHLILLHEDEHNQFEFRDLSFALFQMYRKSQTLKRLAYSPFNRNYLQSLMLKKWRNVSVYAPAPQPELCENCDCPTAENCPVFWDEARLACTTCGYETADVPEDCYGNFAVPSSRYKI